MKKLIYFSIACLALLFIGSCSENETPIYDDSFAALNVWFGTAAGTVTDSTVFNYSYSLGEDSLVFHARVMGIPATEDRSFLLEAVEGDITLAEGSFRTTEYTIKTGETSASFAIYFDSSKLKDANAFTEQDGHLRFRVVENTFFASGAEQMNTLVVVLRNYLSKPEDWEAATYPNLALSRYFGSYSKVKYQFMIQELGLIDFHISYSQQANYDEESNTISYNYASYLQQRMQLALAEYNTSHNTPLTDENGALVTF